MTQDTKEVKIQIKVSDDVLSGKYANNIVVHMNKEEFILDFVGFVPPHATLNSRIVISPGNFKRMFTIMQESLNKFEKEFGPLAAPPSPLPTAEFIQ